MDNLGTLNFADLGSSVLRADRRCPPAPRISIGHIGLCVAGAKVIGTNALRAITGVEYERGDIAAGEVKRYAVCKLGMAGHAENAVPLHVDGPRPLPALSRHMRHARTVFVYSIPKPRCRFRREGLHENPHRQ